MHGQTYGYLPGGRALFPWPVLIPDLMSIGGWVGLSGCLHTKMLYRRTVIHLSTNWDWRRITLLMWPSTLLPCQITRGSRYTLQQAVGVVMWRYCHAPNYSSLTFTLWTFHHSRTADTGDKNDGSFCPCFTDITSERYFRSHLSQYVLPTF